MKKARVVIIALVGLFLAVAGYLLWAEDPGRNRMQVSSEEAASPEKTGAPSATPVSEIERSESYQAAVPYEFTLAGLGLGATPDEVVAILGQPVRKERSSEPDAMASEWILVVDTWSFDGVQVVFINSIPEGSPIPEAPERVGYIVVTEGSYQTLSGIGIGDSLDSIRTVYPEPGAGVELGATIVTFELNKGKVVKIELGQWVD